MEFFKMHGLGNDFAIFDLRAQSLEFTTEQIKQLGNRKLGIGFDQLILLHSTPDADIQMVIYNQDGSPATACGNASRCVAQLLLKEQGTIKVNHRILEYHKDSVDVYSINMGKVTEFEPQFMMNNTEYAYINVGNRHLIMFLADGIEVFRLDETIIPNMPMDYNINLVSSINRNKLLLKTWERGVGFTAACGSGACATFYAAYTKNIVARQDVEVSMLGGSLWLSLNMKDEIIMRGAATHVYTGKILASSSFAS